METRDQIIYQFPDQFADSDVFPNFERFETVNTSSDETLQLLYSDVFLGHMPTHLCKKLPLLKENNSFYSQCTRNQKFSKKNL